MGGEQRFAIPAAPDVLEYLDRVADAMVVLYGVSHAEAIKVINQAFREGQDFADKMNAEASAGMDTRAARAANRMQELGIRPDFIDLTSPSGRVVFLSQLPEYWARLFYAKDRSREPMAGRPIRDDE